MIAWLMFRLLVLMIAVGVSITVFYYMLTLRASGKNRLALQMVNDLDKRNSPTLGDVGDF